MAGNTTPPVGHQPVVVWDDTRVTSTYANRAEVTASREAINILFGVEQTRQAGQDEVRVELSRHVALSPLVAKRLSIALNEALGNHETKLGAREPAPGVSVGERKATPREKRNPSETDEDLGKISTLFRHLGGLDATIDFEPSFKAVHGHLFENRFLLGISRPETGGGLDERIVSICEKIGMPHNLQTSFKRALPDANHVYFGVEKDKQALIFKAYLEYRDKIEKEIGGSRITGQSFPLFTGFKWDTSSPTRQAVTRYAWYPSLPVGDMLERVRIIIEPGQHGELFEIVRGIAEAASERIPHGDIQFLEVTEDGNPRRSFDMNIYKSDLRLEELYPTLSGALRHYAIPAGRFESLYQRIKTERFGHLAGGVDRENKDFMTVYYGVKHIHSHELGSVTIVAGDRLQDGG